MSKLLISGAARLDLVSILEASLSRLGEEGRARYSRLLIQSLRELRAAPEGSATRQRPELAAGMRSLHLGHVRKNPGVKDPLHFLLYRVRKNQPVELLRVLHERLDLRTAAASLVETRRAK